MSVASGITSDLDPGFKLLTMPNAVDLVEGVGRLVPAPDNLVLSYWRELLGGNNVALDLALQDLVSRSEDFLRL